MESRVKGIVEAGGLEAASAYAFGGGSLNNGAAIQAATGSPYSITYTGKDGEIQTYTGFIFVQDAAGENASYTANASISMDNDSTGKTFGFNNQTANFAANAFDVAPEPTSGLLLLLGVAGLALKRRRA